MCRYDGNTENVRKQAGKISTASKPKKKHANFSQKERVIQKITSNNGKKTEHKRNKAKKQSNKRKENKGRQNSKGRE